ncbi:MAG: hypothetical protein WDZ77_01425 [Candidatus Pacearchaeota archaeon]
MGVYNRTSNEWEDLSASDAGDWVGTSHVTGVAVNPNNDLVYTGIDGKLGVYNRTSNEWEDLSASDAGDWVGTSNFESVAVNPNNDLVYTGIWDGKLGVYSDYLKILPGESEIALWVCGIDIGDYRVATLNINANTSTNEIPLRVETYNGTDFVDVLHSKYINTSNNIETLRVPLLQNQINTNEEGLCEIKISNLGNNDLIIDDITLDTYYDEVVSVRDIQAQVGSFNLTGLETSDELLNVSVFTENSFNETHSLDVNLTISNSTTVVHSELNSGLTIGALSSLTTTFENINTSTWTAGNYTLETLITGNFTSTENENRSETLVFEDIQVYASSEKYMCSSTTEEFTVTINHPFTDEIEYNVSLEFPSGWSYSGSQLKNISTIGNTTLTFNITSGTSEANQTINASVEYTYPSSKTKQSQQDIEEGASIPILEVVRETPQNVANSTEFVSRLAVYNKGCALAEDITLKEKVTSGWTAYTPSIDGTLAGVADIPRGEIRYTADNLGTIRAQEYKLLSYFILSSSEIDAAAELRYNLTWGSRNKYEDSAFKINTSRYIDESRLSYNIRTIGSFKDRSAEADDDSLYEFNITNIGDLNIANNTWNVSLSIPSQCTQSNHTGTYNSGTGKITWPLGPLNVSDINTFHLNLNCSTENRYVLSAEAVNDTQTKTSFSNSTNIDCSFSSGNDCVSTESFTFSKPSDARYETLNNVNTTIFYNWDDFKTTIGEGSVNITNDDGKGNLLWQNFSITNPDGTSGTVFSNYTLDDSEKSKFVNSARNIRVRAFVDSTSSPNGNVSVQNIAYTWDHGTLFNETHELFIDIHPFIFDLPTPVLSTPTNNSLQAAVPVGLSWEAIEEPEGVDISYYVFGDDTDASTILDTTEENLYLWRDLGAQQGIFYWKIIATDGISNTTSETRQFELDLCQPNTDFAFAESYPMSYDNITDTITIWGSNGTDFDAMGNNESNPITFQEIFEFGQAVRGVCAVNNPSSGAYVVLSRLELGNTTDSLNTTFVKTTGESLGFGKQVQLNFNATLTSGRVTAGGTPQAGSTLAFSGLDATGNEEGQFYTKSGSNLKLFDTGVSHTIDANNSNPFRLYWNGNTEIRASTLQNWHTIRFFGSNNIINNMILTDMGEGFFPATTQTGTLTTVRPSGIDTGGLMLFTENTSLTEPNFTITGLEVSESTNDILVQNYTGKAILINPTLNFSNINWTEGSFGGSIERKFDYTPTITDSIGASVANTTLVLLDTKGDLIFSLKTDAQGSIPKQIITRALYDYNFKTGDDQGPHTLYIQKYGSNFQTAAKAFSAATVETLQLGDNQFTTLSESGAEALENITYNAPTQVSHGDEINTTWSTSGTLANAPIDQCQFFAIFANSTKLVEGASNNFTINYATGEVTFNQDMSDYEIRPVYSYGGNVTVTNGLTVAEAFTMKDLYDFTQQQTTQNNLSADLLTVDGLTYTFCVDLALGNNDTAGSISDPEATIEFNDGYDVIVGDKGGLLDLAGVGGTGTVENIDVGKPQIKLGETQTVLVSLTNDVGDPLTGETITANVHFPDGTIWLEDKVFTEFTDGFYRLEFNMPSIDNEIPYGIYSVHVFGQGFSAVRTFEFVPELDLISRFRVGDKIFDINLAHLDKGTGNVTLKFETFNPRSENKTFSQFDLWERNYFMLLPTTLMASHFDVDVYEMNNSREINFDSFEDQNISDWSFSGDIINLTVAETTLLRDNFALNVTLNFSTGNGTIAKNISSTDFSNVANELREFDVEYYLPDLQLENISIKLKTNETDYFVENRELRGWKILFSGESATHIDSFDYDKLQTFGNPNISNITGIEITFIGTDNYTTPTSILVDDVELHKLEIFPHDRMGSKFLSSVTSTLFWWNGDGTYRLESREEKEYTVILQSLEFEWLTTWANDFPNDAFIQEKYQEALDANFYYEILVPFEQVKGYLLANTDKKLFIVSDIGTSYNPGDKATANIVTYDNTANLVTANVTVTAKYPNGTTFSQGTPTESSTGIYNYSFVIPSTLGDYSTLITANDSVNKDARIHTISVVSATSGSGTGGLALNMFNSVGSSYDLGETVRLFTTTVNSSGSLVNSTVNVATFDPDGTQINSGESIRISEGRFEYNFTAPSTEGTYRLNIDSNYSGDEAHDTEAFIISSGGGSGGDASVPQIQVEAPNSIDTNTNFSITSLTTNKNGVATSCDSGANVTIRDTLAGTNLVDNEAMTNFGTGLYNYTYSTGTSSSFLTVIDCTISGVEYKGIKSFSTQGVALPSGAVVEMSDFDEVLAGNDYRAKVWVFDQNGNPINANSIPTVTLYDPLRNIIVQDVSMTQDSTGIYVYNFTTSSTQTGGVWETIANVVVNGVTYSPSDFWELESSPAEVKINEISDKTVPTISADVTITNEGNSNQEYQYEYCIVSQQSNQCGGDDDEDYASGAKLLSPGQSFNPTLNLEVLTAGDYYFKLVVYFGTEKSGASQLFTAVDEDTTTSEPSSGGGSGSAGGGGAATPSEELPVEGKSELFNIEINIPERNQRIAPGENIAAGIKITDFSSVKGAKNITLYYYIENSKGIVYSEKFEQLTLNEVLEILREIKIPKDTPEGAYSFVAKIEYQEEVAIGKKTFSVVKEDILTPPLTEKVNLYLIAIILIVALIILLLMRFFYGGKRGNLKKDYAHRKRKWFGKSKTAHSYHERESLKKIIRHIKE